MPTDAEHSKQREIHETSTLIKIPRRQRKDHGRSQRGALECGDAANAQAAAPTCPRRLVRLPPLSLHDPQYASKPNGSEGRLQLVWLGRRHMPTRHVRTSRACTVEVEEKNERMSGKGPCHLWFFFFRWEEPSPHSHPGWLRPAHGAALSMQVITADAA